MSTSTIEYRGYQIEQTVQISKSPHFDNAISYRIMLDGATINGSVRSVLDAVRWIDRTVRAAA